MNKDKDFLDILAKELNCDRTEVTDTLFPIAKGYTEKERFTLMNAIFMAMAIA